MTRARQTAAVLAAALATGLLVTLGLLLNRPAQPAATHAPAADATASSEHSPVPLASAKSAPPIHPRHRDPLGAEARSYLSSRVGVVLAAVYDIDSDQIWTIGQGPPQAEASVVKLDILETLLAQRRESGIGLSGDEDVLARQMIEDSDNGDATILWYAVGGAAGIRTFNGAVGLADTSPSRCVQCPGFPWPGWGLTTTTATDQIALLRELVEPSTLLTRSQRSYVLRLMENVAPSQRWGVSYGVPAQATVAVKDGWLPLDGSETDWQINSMGWISGDGRNYLMAVLTTGSPAEQYGIDTIDRLSAIVWSAMGLYSLSAGIVIADPIDKSPVRTSKRWDSRG